MNSYGVYSQTLPGIGLLSAWFVLLSSIMAIMLGTVGIVQKSRARFYGTLGLTLASALLLLNVGLIILLFTVSPMTDVM